MPVFRARSRSTVPQRRGAGNRGSLLQLVISVMAARAAAKLARIRRPPTAWFVTDNASGGGNTCPGNPSLNRQASGSLKLSWVARVPSAMLSASPRRGHDDYLGLRSSTGGRPSILLPCRPAVGSNGIASLSHRHGRASRCEAAARIRRPLGNVSGEGNARPPAIHRSSDSHRDR